MMLRLWDKEEMEGTGGFIAKPKVSLIELVASQLLCDTLTLTVILLAIYAKIFFRGTDGLRSSTIPQYLNV